MLHRQVFGAERFQIDFLLLGATERVGAGVQLRLEAVQDLEIALLLLGELSKVAALVHSQAFFLLGQILAGLLQLMFQKLGGTNRLLGALLEAFLDEKRGQLTRDLLGDMRAPRRIVDAKSVCAFAAPGRLHKVDEDVVPHLVNDLIHGQASAFPGVETELLDQMLQARVTENLLGHALQAILEVGDNIGRHILHRHLLLLDEDQGFRTVAGGPRQRDTKAA